MPRTASTGPRFKEAADKYIADGKNKQDAFRQVALDELRGESYTPDELDKKQKAVASAYYRHERATGNGAASESGDSPAPRKRGRPKGSTNKAKPKVSKPAGEIGLPRKASGQSVVERLAALETQQAQIDELVKRVDHVEKILGG